MEGYVEVYAFSSTNLENIGKAVEAGRWAIRRPDPRMPLEKRAMRMLEGSRGIFYCSSSKSLTVPFLVTSPPDLGALESGPWEGEWAFPFGIKPLGDPWQLLHKREIPDYLSHSIPRGSRWSDILHIQAITVFNPSSVAERDWWRIVEKLGKG